MQNSFFRRLVSFWLVLRHYGHWRVQRWKKLMFFRGTIETCFISVSYTTVCDCACLSSPCRTFSSRRIMVLLADVKCLSEHWGHGGEGGWVSWNIQDLLKKCESGVIIINSCVSTWDHIEMSLPPSPRNWKCGKWACFLISLEAQLMIGADSPAREADLFRGLWGWMVKIPFAD